MVLAELPHQTFIGRMGAFDWAPERLLLFWWIEVERKLDGMPSPLDQASERSKQRCGPGMNVLFALDQM